MFRKVAKVWVSVFITIRLCCFGDRLRQLRVKFSVNDGEAVWSSQPPESCLNLRVNRLQMPQLDRLSVMGDSFSVV